MVKVAGFDLIPCLHCKGEKLDIKSQILDKDWSKYWVECKECGHQGHGDIMVSFAVRFWNKFNQDNYLGIY